VSLDMRQFRSVSRLEMDARRAAEAAAGCRLRHNKRGKGPDWLNKSRRVAVYIHGCFWHGCLLHSSLPKSNPDYWRAKIEKNRQRDKTAQAGLEGKGWKVVVLWEHDLQKRLLSISNKKPGCTEEAYGQATDRQGG